MLSRIAVTATLLVVGGCPATSTNTTSTKAAPGESSKVCEVDDDCVAIRHACVVGVANRAHEAELREEFRGMHVDCPRPPSGQWPKATAACVDHVCTDTTPKEKFE